MPELDFSKSLVVFSRNVDFYNPTRILKVMLKDGTVEVVAMKAMSAIAIEDKVAMAMVVIPRAHVKSIQTGSAQLPVGTDRAMPEWTIALWHDGLLLHPV